MAQTRLQNPKINLKKHIIILMLLLICYMLFYSKHEWDIQKENELLNLKNLVDINAHSIDSYLCKVEFSLLQLREKMIETGQPINLNKAEALLKDYHRLNPELANISFSNHEGKILLASSVLEGNRQ